MNDFEKTMGHQRRLLALKYSEKQWLVLKVIYSLLLSITRLRQCFHYIPSLKKIYRIMTSLMFDICIKQKRCHIWSGILFDLYELEFVLFLSVLLDWEFFYFKYECRNSIFQKPMEKMLQWKEWTEKLLSSTLCLIIVYMSACEIHITEYRRRW